mgnify:CR=1 FL=1
MSLIAVAADAKDTALLRAELQKKRNEALRNAMKNRVLDRLTGGGQE